jgi:tetratricopeptide (TPR) repeat protein
VLGASIADQALLTPRLPPGFGVRAGFFPEGASAFLERHRLDGRLFNAYEFGGYLIWRRWPANQVLIDGRYDAVLFDERLLQDYEAAYRSPAALDRITAAYGVDILVLNANPTRQRIPFLDAHPAWARVYWDNVAEVFVRREGRHAGLAADHEYRLTRAEPDLGYLAAYRADRETWSRAVAELKRAAAENPENTWAWLGLAQESRAAGPSAARDRLEALTHLVALLPSRPTTGGLHAERAEVLLQLGRSDEAAAAALQALRLDGSLLPARWILAIVAEGRGNWAEARDQYRAILARVDAGHAGAPAIRARLDAAERALKAGGGR